MTGEESIWGGISFIQFRDFSHSSAFPTKTVYAFLISLIKFYHLEIQDFKSPGTMGLAAVF
jgi:hypothetical protein